MLSNVVRSSLILCLWVRPEPTREKHLSAATLLVRLLALPAQFGQGWKDLVKDKHSS
jgi:hypothetical protein